jgi:hypothetical protein
MVKKLIVGLFIALLLALDVVVVFLNAGDFAVALKRPNRTEGVVATSLRPGLEADRYV